MAVAQINDEPKTDDEKQAVAEARAAWEARGGKGNPS